MQRRRASLAGLEDYPLHKLDRRDLAISCNDL